MLKQGAERVRHWLAHYDEVVNRRMPYATGAVTIVDAGATRKQKAPSFDGAGSATTIHRSLHKHHLPGLDVLTSSQAVEVDTAGQACGVPRGFEGAC